jgi:hypothetical protein
LMEEIAQQRLDDARHIYIPIKRPVLGISVQGQELSWFRQSPRGTRAPNKTGNAP